MKKIRIWATVTLTLGILGFVLLFFMFLALADISHGEQDLSLGVGHPQARILSSSSS